MIKQLRSDPPTPYREWYNARVLTLPAARVLDVGRGVYWDYSDVWPQYDVIDSDPGRCPTILGDITRSGLPSGAYDLILCNGMYEYVADAPAMVREVHRLLCAGGLALFGFVGFDYRHTRGPKFDGDTAIFDGFRIVEQKHFGREYHFYLCQK